jgi:hypothetical protein
VEQGAGGRRPQRLKLSSRYREIVMQIAIWLVVVLVIAALLKYLLSDSGKK